MIWTCAFGCGRKCMGLAQSCSSIPTTSSEHVWTGRQLQRQLAHPAEISRTLPLRQVFT